jgi:hypothetical protein
MGQVYLSTPAWGDTPRLAGWASGEYGRPCRYPPCGVLALEQARRLLVQAELLFWCSRNRGQLHH